MIRINIVMICFTEHVRMSRKQTTDRFKERFFEKEEKTKVCPSRLPSTSV